MNLIKYSKALDLQVSNACNVQKNKDNKLGENKAKLKNLKEVLLKSYIGFLRNLHS